MDFKELRNNIDKTVNNIPNYLFILPYILHTLSTDNLFKIHNKIGNTPSKVYDVIISNINDYTSYRSLTDVIAVIILAYLLSKYIYLNRYKLGEKNVKIKNIGTTIFKYISIIILIRSLTIQMTVLPTLTNINIPANLLERFTKGHTCDYIFSGHTSVILIIILSFYKHKLIDTNEFKLVSFLHLLMAILLVITKGHYTIDIFLGFLVAIAVFLIFDL